MKENTNCHPKLYSFTTKAHGEKSVSIVTKCCYYFFFKSSYYYFLISIITFREQPMCLLTSEPLALSRALYDELHIIHLLARYLVFDIQYLIPWGRNMVYRGFSTSYNEAVCCGFVFGFVVRA